MKSLTLFRSFSCIRLLITVIALAATAGPAFADYDVTISSAAGANGAWSGGTPDVWTPSGAGSNVSVAELQTRLATGVTITTSGGGAENGDILVNEAVSWSADTTLTLSAYGNVKVNSNITATGNTAGLVLTPNIGLGGGSYSLNNGAVITLSGATPSLIIAGNAYTVINEANGGVTALQNMSSNLSGKYVLGANIDASGTSTWNTYGSAVYYGFTPIGNSSASIFTGIFDGLGHTITDLTITRPSANVSANDYVGLFGYVGSGSAVRNIGLKGGTVSGKSYVGGLVGRNAGGTISNAYATGTVTGSSENIGGLVGYNAGTISNAYATGNVVAVSGSSSYVGGLVGNNSAGTISNSYATGNVSGNSTVGGLVGWNASTISNAYATGTVSGGSGSFIGGLVGYHWSGTVSNAYATGAVSGGTYVGGLAGSINAGSISNAYATGAVSGTENVNGLAGSKPYVAGSTVGNSFYDTETTGQNSACGPYSSACNATGKTTAEMKQQATFTGWDFTNTWFMVDGSTRPFLRSEYSTTIINTHQLQLMAMDLTASYTLDRDIDFGTTFTDTSRSDMWATSTSGSTITGAGFAPIGGNGDWNSKFTGTFDGLGHTITGLTINRPSAHYVGLFGVIGPGGAVRNVGLVGGSVTGDDGVGGLAGHSWGGTISNAYATGAVSGDQEIGGLVGYQDGGGAISNAYATGNVTGRREVGGLVGANYATITNAYATGAVTGSDNYNVGGLAGINGGTVGNSNYWDKDTTGQSAACGSGTCSATGLTTTNALVQSSYSGFDFTSVWRIYEDYTYPLLKSFLTPLTITADNVSKTYDGLAYTSALTNPSYSVAGADTSGRLFNTTNPYNSAVNVGSYTPDLYSDQQGYDISYQNGTLTIDPADTTPGAFTFIDQTEVALNTLVTSNTITVSGINTAAAISVTGGEYKINGGSWTSASGTVNNNDTVTVRQTSSGSYSTKTDAVLTVGDVSDTFSVTTFAPICVNPPSGMVSWWKGENNANDSVGTNNGTAQNGATYAAGKVGQAFSFNGVDSKVQAQSAFTSSTSFSISFWIKVNSFTHQYYMAPFSQNLSALNYFTWVTGELEFGFVGRWADGTPFDLRTDAGGNSLSPPFGIGVWKHLTVTYDGSAMKQYVDGSLQNAKNYTGKTLGNNEPFMIGQGAAYPNGTLASIYFDGLVDEAALYNRTLSASEIAAIYSAGSAGNCAIDSTPEAFAFTDQTGAGLSTVITSNTITVSGINFATASSITGGEYQINSGSWTSASGTVNNGDTVTVRQTSSSSYSTQTDAALTIGGVSDTFSVTTLAAYTTPEAFSFEDQTGIVINTLVSSNTITVAGINTTADISITGGEYRINGGDWTSAAGTVNNGNAVSARQASSPNYSTKTVAVLTIGGVSDTFSVTTSSPCATQPSGLVSWWGGDNNALELISANSGTLMNGAAYAAGKVGQAFSLDGVDDYIDMGNSDAFNFGSNDFAISFWAKPGNTADGADYDQIIGKAALSSLSPYQIGIHGSKWLFWSSSNGSSWDIASEYSFGDITQNSWQYVVMTRAGNEIYFYLNGVKAATLSTSSALWSNTEKLLIGKNLWTAQDTHYNGLVDEVQIYNRAMTASEILSIYNAGGTGVCRSCTPQPTGMVSWWDGEVDAKDRLGLNHGTLMNGVTNAAGKVGQAFSFDGADDYVSLGTSAGNFGSSDYSLSFWIKTTATPAGYMEIMNKRGGGAPSGWWHLRMDHAGILFTEGVGGLANTTPINDGEFHRVDFTRQGTFNSLYVDGSLESSAASEIYDMTSSVELMIGYPGYPDGTAFFQGLMDEVQIFSRSLSADEIAAAYNAGSAGTCSDTAPDSFSFTAQTGVAVSTQVSSNTITVSGINTAASVSITGGEYLVSNGTWTSFAGTVNNGDTVSVRQASSTSYSTQTDAVLTIGDVSDTFSVTTFAADSTPDAFNFTDQTGITLSTQVSSNIITVTGINTTAEISIIGGEYSVNGGSYTSAAGTVNNGDAVSVRQTSSSNISTTTDAVLTIGVVSYTFSVTTSTSCATPPSGLVSWWGGDNNALELISANSGTLMNGAAYAAGKVGQSFSFDGVDDYIDLGSSPSLDLGDFTLGAWVYIDSSTNTGERRLISRDDYGQEGSDGREYFILKTSSPNNCGAGNRPMLEISLGDLLCSPYDLTTGWHHIAATRAGSALSLYVDGVSVASASGGGLGVISPDAPLVIGTLNQTINQVEMFQGLADEITVFNRALGTTEIQGINNAGGTGMCRPSTAQPSGLVSWWGGDNNALDMAGTNNGTLVNGAAYGAGKVGQAFSFDGDAAYANIPSNASLDITSALSIDAWIKPAGAGRSNGIVVMKNPLKYGLIWFPGSQKVTFSLDINGWGDYVSNGTVLANQWTHVVGTYDGASVKIYINGVLDAEYSKVGSIATSSGDLSLGASASEFFNGLIDEVHIFNRALGATEIQGIYNAGGTGICRSCTAQPTGMISRWAGENDAQDAMGANHGTTNGTAFASGKVGQAFSFTNGGTNFVAVPDSSSINFGGNANHPMSLSLWVKRTASSGMVDYRQIMGKRPDCGAEVQYDLEWSSNSGYGIYGVCMGSSSKSVCSGNPDDLPLDTWTHVSFSYDGTTGTIYINGRAAGSGPFEMSPNSAPLYIGTAGNCQNTGSGFDGMVDEVELLDRALSADEIAASYNAGSAGTCADTTPDSFLFTGQTGLALNTLVSSNTITVSGLNTAANITITGGEYQLNGGGWSLTGGTVYNGDTVTARQSSSINSNTQTDTVVTIGGVSGTFSVTTHVAVNGTCGISSSQTFTTAPAANLCSSGTTTGVSGSGPWSWTCIGQYTGSDAGCSANIQTYTLTFQTDGNGALTGASIQTINHGGNATAVTANANTNYHFVNWIGTGGFSTTSTNPLTVTNITSSITITANFTRDAVNGACGASSGQTFTTTPATNLCSAGTITGVTGSGPWTWTCSGQYTGTNADCSANIQTYTLTFQSDGNGTLTGASIQTISHGGSATAVTANANTNYHFVNWTGTGGFSPTTSNPLTVTNVTSSMTITANFTHGAVNGSCGLSSGQTFTAAPATNLCSSGTSTAFAGSGPWTWICGGQYTGTDASCSANIQTWHVTPSAGAGGTISPSTPQTVNNNAATTFTITPDAGHSVSSVTGCGGSLSGNSYITGQVTGNCAVNASFTANPAPIAPSGDLNGDSTLDVADALKALRVASGLDAVTAGDISKGDVAPLVNGVPQPDGKIDIGDVVVILRKAVGLVGW